MVKSVFESKEQYIEFVNQWKKACNDLEGPKLEFQHFILYAMLKGKDWSKCVSEHSTDSTKDAVKYWTEECNPKYLSLWPFGETITVEMIEKARAIMEAK